jgi:hypothetical protein
MAQLSFQMEDPDVMLTFEHEARPVVVFVETQGLGALYAAAKGKIMAQTWIASVGLPKPKQNVPDLPAQNHRAFTTKCTAIDAA